MVLDDVIATASPQPVINQPGLDGDALAHAFLAILAGTANFEITPTRAPGEPEDPVDRLLGDSSDKPDAASHSIRPDVAAAAVLTARAIEAVPGLIRDLRRGSPVVSIAARSADWVSLVGDVLEECVFGSDEEVMVPKRYGEFRRDRTALLVARDGADAGHTPDKGNDTIAAAVHARSPIVGVAPEPCRHLPRDLMRAAEHHLVLGDIDETVIALVIDAVTGRPLDRSIDPELVRAVDVSDLRLAVRRHLTPEECLQRLDTMVRNKGSFDHSGPRLEDLSGYGVAKDWGLHLAADLAAYRRGDLDWASIDKGLLLDGPPGVGKTQYAKALARSAGVPLVATSVAEWNAVNYLSGTLQAMRATFAQARKLAPAILFIDELDGISDRARLQGDYVEYWSQIVNLLLELLAGVNDRPGVVVIGATNHPDRIDPAIRRAGRLDRTITIERPGTDDLCKIFRYYLKQDLADADLVPLALAARGGTGADVQAWVQRARSHARRGDRALTVQDILHEVSEPKIELPARIRRAIAIHEAGHVVIGTLLGCYAPTMVWVSETGGQTSGQLELSETMTLSGLENLISTLLAGRAAEELLLGTSGVTTGSGVGDDSDLRRATEIALDIEIRFGFGRSGLVSFPDSSRGLLRHDKNVLAAIEHRLNTCLERASALIEAHRIAVLSIADALDAERYLEEGSILQLLKQHQVIQG